MFYRLAQREALLHFSDDHAGGEEIPEKEKSDVKKTRERNQTLLQASYMVATMNDNLLELSVCFFSF